MSHNENMRHKWYWMLQGRWYCMLQGSCSWQCEQSLHASKAIRFGSRSRASTHALVWLTHDGLYCHDVDDKGHPCCP